MNCHELKILPQYFEAVVNGSKTFEIRKNDRDFKVGDIVNLREYNGTEYTGRSILKQITFITDYAQKENYVVFSIEDLNKILDLADLNLKNAETLFRVCKKFVDKIQSEVKTINNKEYSLLYKLIKYCEGDFKLQYSYPNEWVMFYKDYATKATSEHLEDVAEKVLHFEENIDGRYPDDYDRKTNPINNLIDYICNSPSIKNATLQFNEDIGWDLDIVSIYSPNTIISLKSKKCAEAIFQQMLEMVKIIL